MTLIPKHSPHRDRKLLQLGTKTRWGRIEMVALWEGERYYWMLSDGVVSMMPASVVEK